MNCIIIDDDATARLITKQLCLKSEQVTVVDEFSSAIDAIKYLNTASVDLVFLDIHMPTFSGFDFIQTLKNPPRIILTTSDKNLALEAFEYKSVVDYLVKPITKDRFNKSLEKLEAFTFSEDIKKEDKSKSDFIYVNVDRRLVKVSIPSIYLIEAKGDYILVKTDSKNYTVHSTLKKIEEKLPESLFLKIHRSYIINLKSLQSVQGNTHKLTLLLNNISIPVSKNYHSRLKSNEYFDKNRKTL